jgi:hypothetical protein
MFLRNGKVISRSSKKRARELNAVPAAEPRKTRAVKHDAPRLPDYLAKRKDAEALQDLFANTDDRKLYKDMLEIARKCHEKKFNLEYLHDWLAIYQFLHNPELVNSYLDRLEQALQDSAHAVAKRSKFSLNDDEKWLLPESRRNPYARHKVLSSYLYDWAQEHGFKQKAKFIGLLSGETFLGMLRAKSIFKDSSVSANIHHGAWSHALQWYCIIEHFKDAPFLLHRPLEVLQSFGDAKQLITSRILNLAWDYILDRSGDDLFSSPTAITNYLMESESRYRWPLLAESVARQEEKSSNKFGDYYDYTCHLAEKHVDEHGKQTKVVIRKL